MSHVRRFDHVGLTVADLEVGGGGHRSAGRESSQVGELADGTGEVRQ
jgi:hypothetical protein